MIDLWQVLAGTTIFVLGMNFLEEALQIASGRKFKLFLKKHTHRVVSAIGIGTFASGILQSSSVVNMLILSLTGTGTIPLRNALAVTLGSNLGTTLNTWILSSIGFRFDITSIAFPAIAVSGVARILLKDKRFIYNWFSALLGLGFIMLGLEFIKGGMKAYVADVDLALFNDYPVVVHLFVGLVITTMLQSSAAVVVIVLSALHSHAIGLYAATAVVLGSEIGTTIKFLLVSYGRAPSVKRVAVGNLVFNILNAAVILIFLAPINWLITTALSVKDPLIALAVFQTFINATAIALCAPLLGFTEKLLTVRFTKDPVAPKYIGGMPVPDTDLAIAALKAEALCFQEIIMHYAGAILNCDKDLFPGSKEKDPAFFSQSREEQYRFIKQRNGDIYKYYLAMRQKENLSIQIEEIDKIMSSVHQGIFAAKSLHDAELDISHLSRSANEIKYGFYTEIRDSVSTLLRSLCGLLKTDSNQNHIAALVEAYKVIQANYNHSFKYYLEKTTALTEVEISTLINLNRELFNAFHAIVLGLKDLLLATNDRKLFEDFVEKETIHESSIGATSIRRV